MTRPHALLAALLGCALMTNAAIAGGYSGPGAATRVTTVAAALSAADDTPAVLQGHILRHHGNERYAFSDASGEILAEIDDDEWPARVIDAQTRVRLIGEVERGLFKRTLDVDRVEIID